MIPILFDANATIWTTNGLGRLEAISCVVTEELNGLYELEMTYPVSGTRFADLAVSNIILAQPYDGAPAQPFRIYKVSKEMSGRVTVSARHISYQLNWIPVMPFNYSSLSDCLTKLKSQSVYTNPFTFWTNKTVTTGGAFTEPLPCRSMLGGVQGSVLQRYGGDYEWDGYTVKLWLRRGSDTGVRISYGKNLISAQQETDIENTYTGVCPYYIDSDTNEVTTLPEKYVLASTSGNFPFLRIQTVDFSSDFEETPTVAQLRARAQTYVTANNIGHPKINVDIDFVALWQTSEYANIAPLERVQLGDTVTVYFERLGINETARVVAYEYDVLRERYNKITIGDAKSSLAKTIVDQGRILEDNIQESAAVTLKNAKSIVEFNTAWLTNGQGYVVAVKNSDGSWKEILFMNTPSTATATRVLRINENGIGFSSTGVNGPYAQAWTLEGTLSLGGVNNKYGKLVLLSNSGQKIIDLDKNGLGLYNTSGKLIAELWHNGLAFDYYNSQGTMKSNAWLDGEGLYIAETGSNSAEIELSAGQLSVSDAGGDTSMMTGSTLDVAGVSIYEERVVAPTVEAGTLEVGGIEVNGEEGQNTVVTIGGWEMFFNGGVLTAVEAGEPEEEGYTGMAWLEGDGYRFVNGRLIDIE